MARFDELDAMGDSIGKVYADCVDRLLVNIARHFKYLQPGEEPGGAFQWQARKLAELGQVNRENVAIIRRMLGDVPAELAEGLEQAIMDALADIEEPLRKAAEDGLIGGGTLLAAPDPRAMQAFTLYHGQSLDGLNLVNSRMLESTAEAYRGMVADITNRLLNARGTINAATGEVLAGVESFNRALELATRRLLDEGLTGFVDGDGRRWKPDTYVAMTMRSTYHNVSRAAFWERNEEYANDLYLVSQHPGARPLCYPWQCKVISRKDEAREELDGDDNPVHVYAQSETTYGEPAGLFGINCGHHPELFIPGATKIPELMQNEQENAETYALSQKQRKLEREFRKARLEYATAKAQGADEAAVKAAQEKLKQADERLDRFEKETGRRRRREREYGPTVSNQAKPQMSAENRLTDGQIGFKKDADPIRQYLGSASSSHPEMVEHITQELQSKGIKVTIEDSREVMGYFPSTVAGKPGEFKVSKDASISAWMHEQQHAQDDEESGWRGSRIVWDTEQSIAWEQRAYQKEIDFAQKLGYTDVVEELRRLLRKEIERRRE